MRFLILFLLGCCLIVTPLLAQEAPTFQTLKHDGQTRTYTLHTPAQLDDSETHPLVIVLHPASSSGKAMEMITGFDADADEHGYFVVYPDSLGAAWDDYRGLEVEGAQAVDDVGFMKSLITTLAAEHPIDPDQVHLVGMANGGAFALRAACEASEDFASFTIVSAQMWSYQMEPCPEVGVVRPMLFVHGMADAVYEIGGHYFADTPQSITSLNDTMEFWRDRYGCAVPQGVTSSTVFFEYGDCRGGGLYLFAIPGAGGAWHQGERDLVNPGGPDYTRLISSFMRGDSTWGQMVMETYTLTSLPRTYTLYVPPSYTGDSPVPLMVLLHGRTGTGAGMAQVTQMNTLAARDNFVAVYPDGLQNQWNYGRGWAIYQTGEEINDEVFLTRMLRSLGRDINLDASKRYVTGFSNGGFMTQRLACTMRGEFAAFASVGATAPNGLTQGCMTSPAHVPILYIHGTKDPSVPWSGTTTNIDGRRVYITATMDNTLNFWVDHNGCDVNVDVETLPKLDETDPTETMIFTLQKCPADGPVILYAVKEGGHRWHGADAVLDQSGMGISSPDFNASEVVWEFFQRFPLASEE